jgi:transcriptional antiterminator NusG
MEERLVPRNTRQANSGGYYFERGDVVRIVAGPFRDFNGTITDINVEEGKLKVVVNIFDRETPVELGFDQVIPVPPW